MIEIGHFLLRLYKRKTHLYTNFVSEEREQI